MNAKQINKLQYERCEENLDKISKQISELGKFDHIKISKLEREFKRINKLAEKHYRKTL